MLPNVPHAWFAPEQNSSITGSETPPPRLGWALAKNDETLSDLILGDVTFILLLLSGRWWRWYCEDTRPELQLNLEMGQHLKQHWQCICQAGNFDNIPKYCSNVYRKVKPCMAYILVETITSLGRAFLTGELLWQWQCYMSGTTGTRTNHDD